MYVLLQLLRDVCDWSALTCALAPLPLKLCAWDNTAEKLDFSLLVNLMRQLVGRGTETSRLAFQDLNFMRPTEFPRLHQKIFQIFMARDKNTVMQDLATFPHSTHWQLCVYFTLAQALATRRNPLADPRLVPTAPQHLVSETLASMPQFGQTQDGDSDEEEPEAAAVEGALAQDRRRAQTVSAYFKRILTQLINCSKRIGALAYELDEEAHLAEEGNREETEEEAEDRRQAGAENEARKLAPSCSLSSHSCKKHGVEGLTANPFIRTTTVLFRAGWLVQAVHTIFDYLDQRNPISDRSAARVLAGWGSQSCNGLIQGGIPPSLEHLQAADQALAKQIAKNLFFQ
jgi:hypothetical protein